MSIFHGLLVVLPQFEISCVDIYVYAQWESIYRCSITYLSAIVMVYIYIQEYHALAIQ